MKSRVTVETFSRMIDARLAQARLEGAGVRSFLADESVAAIDPFLINAIGGVKLQVEIDDEVLAREILSRPLDDESAGEVDEFASFCPRCESEYVFGDEQQKCKRCGFEGVASDFASTEERRKARADRKASAVTPANRPVFRLERHRGLVGGIIGFAAGFLVTVFVGKELGVVGFVVGMVVGTAFGRSRKYWVCSEPTCRGPIGPDDVTCDRCNRTVRGIITDEREHFVRIAAWERERSQGASTNGMKRHS